MTWSTLTYAHVQAFEVVDPCLANPWEYTPFTFKDYFNLQNYNSLKLQVVQGVNKVIPPSTDPFVLQDLNTGLITDHPPRCGVWVPTLVASSPTFTSFSLDPDYGTLSIGAPVPDPPIIDHLKWFITYEKYSVTIALDWVDRPKP